MDYFGYDYLSFSFYTMDELVVTGFGLGLQWLVVVHGLLDRTLCPQLLLSPLLANVQAFATSSNHDIPADSSPALSVDTASWSHLLIGSTASSTRASTREHAYQISSTQKTLGARGYIIGGYIVI